MARSPSAPVGGRMLVGRPPWFAVPVAGLVLTARMSPWLALFGLLAATQTAHLLEHLAQMVQLHALGLPASHARGVIGALDIEWVHFLWNTWVGLAALALLHRYPRNYWLWLTFAIAAWHGIEHAYILSVYLATGTAGTPGFAARGGLLGGGLPLARPDLHFAYNVVETAPLVLAFLHQLRRQRASLRLR